MRPLNGLNRCLLAMFLGLALAVLLVEALLRLLSFSLALPPVRELLAAGTLNQPALLIVLGLIGLLAAAAGGALAALRSGYVLLALPVGLLCGLSQAFTALVGMQPLAWAMALGLAPILGALLAVRTVQRLAHLDAEDVRQTSTSSIRSL